jgi:predicted 2-oxoglutarate/Fe(II)-dependent dioxygenase YbiX
MNKPDATLKDFIHVERAIIPRHICAQVVAEIEPRGWRPHAWYGNVQNKSVSLYETQELDVQDCGTELFELLSPWVAEAGRAYSAKFSFPAKLTQPIARRFSAIRFNRYSPGQIMRQHQDHIHNLFDGEHRGIPVFSLIGNLNEGYEGADLYFWEEYKVPLGVGDICLFPSLFMYPHGVTEATRGRRYSFVCWYW